MAPEWPVLGGTQTRAAFATSTAPAAATEAWRVDAGRGLNSPLVASDQVLIATAASRDVIALDPATGERFWQRKAEGAVIGGAVIHAGRLIVATGDDDAVVQALDPATGATLWSLATAPAVHAPAAAGGRVFVGTESGTVTGIDLETGSEAWRIRLPRPVSSTPTPVAGQLVVTAQDTVYILSAETGVIRWRMPLPAPVGAAIAARADTVYVPLRSGEIVALTVNGRQELWRANVGEHPILAAPIAGPDGSLYVLNRAAEIWRIPAGTTVPVRVAELGGAARESFALVRDGVLVGRVDGALFLVRPDDGGVVWRHDFDDAIRAPVTVHDGAIYVPLLRGTIAKLR